LAVEVSGELMIWDDSYVPEPGSGVQQLSAELLVVSGD
jgi:hypothetical protein